MTSGRIFGSDVKVNFVAIELNSPIATNANVKRVAGLRLARARLNNHAAILMLKQTDVHHQVASETPERLRVWLATSTLRQCKLKLRADREPARLKFPLCKLHSGSGCFLIVKSATRTGPGANFSYRRCSCAPETRPLWVFGASSCDDATLSWRAYRAVPSCARYAATLPWACQGMRPILAKMRDVRPGPPPARHGSRALLAP